MNKEQLLTELKRIDELQKEEDEKRRLEQEKRNQELCNSELKELYEYAIIMKNAKCNSFMFPFKDLLALQLCSRLCSPEIKIVFDLFGASKYLDENILLKRDIQNPVWGMVSLDFLND